MMFTIEREISIDCPPDEVFAFLDNPRNHVKITPSLVSIGSVETLPNGGTRAEYQYKLAGVTLTGRVEDIERLPDSRLVQELSGTIRGTITYDLDADVDTVVRYRAEYQIPDTVTEAVLEPVARAYNEREAEATLENLKTFLETDARS